jgi:hypothetical protein
MRRIFVALVTLALVLGACGGAGSGGGNTGDPNATPYTY